MLEGVNWAQIRNALMVDGGLTLPGFIAPATLQAIELEIAPWCAQIAFNEIPGYCLVGENRWLIHLGLVSPTALRLALDERILDLMESIFGEKAILAEFSYQEKIQPQNIPLKMHRDNDGGILIFFYLSGVNSQIGSTRFIPGTQNIPITDQFIPQNQYDSTKIVNVEGGPGTAFLFDQDIYHDLPAFPKPGRRAIWCLYQPVSRPQSAVDHLYRQNYLAQLTPRQLAAFGIGQAAFGREGYFRFIGSPLTIAHFKTLLKSVLRFKNFGRPKTFVKARREPKPRMRAPL